MKVLFELDNGKTVLNDYGLLRYGPLMWVITYAHDNQDKIIWPEPIESGLPMFKARIEKQHDIQLDVTKIDEGHILTVTFANEADEAEFIMRML